MKCWLLYSVLVVWAGILINKANGLGVFISVKNQTVIENQLVFVFCNASTLNNVTVEWLKEDNLKYTVRSPNAHLNFTRISRLDAGHYICNATNGSTYFTDDTFLWVQYQPEITIIGPSIVIEKSKTTLRCSASGYPTPTIKFLKEGGHTVKDKKGEAIIVLDRVLRNSTGSYRCNASNGVGRDQTNTTYLNVQYPPEIQRNDVANPISSWLGHVVNITCRAFGNPPPTVTWYKNQFHWGSVLGINVSRDYQFGDYTCVASNKLGNATHVVTINRTRFPPDAPVITNNKSTIDSRNFTLTWSKPRDNGSPILMYHVHQTSFFKNGSLKFDKEFVASLSRNLSFFISWETTCQFAVKAANRQGTSDKGIAKNITVIAEPVKGAIKEPSSALVVYGTIGAVVALLIIIVTVVIVACYRKRQRIPPPCPKQQGDIDNILMSELVSNISKQNRTTRNHNGHYKSHSSYNDSTSGEDVQNQSPIYDNMAFVDKSVRDWEVPRENVNIEKVIGKGAFCQVAKAFVTGLGTVAVKMIRDKSGSEANRRDLLAEYKLLQNLGTHENVILMLGAVTATDPIMVLFEYVPFGDLLGYLRRSRGLNDTYYKNPDKLPSSTLTSDQLLRLSREVAEGMAFLSSKKIIHRDLAARNVLVCRGEKCKITDFGMARNVANEDIYQKRSRGRLPVKWTAYEALLYGFYSTQSDVWSYAIVLYEIFTIGGCPYPGKDGRHIGSIIQNGYRMPKPKHLDDEIYALMSECWKTEPEARPTFDAIVKTLRRLELHRKEYICMNDYDVNLYENLDDLM